MLQQHRPGHDPAFVADQILQKLEFPGKKPNVLAPSAGSPGYQIHREIADAQNGLLDDGVTAPSKRLDARQQFDERKGLDQIVVATGPQAAHPIIDFSQRTYDQDRRSDAHVAQSTHDCDSIDVREHAIDRDHRILASNAAAQRLAAVRCNIHLITITRERVRKLPGGLRIIFNDQNSLVTSRHDIRPDHWPRPACFSVLAATLAGNSQVGCVDIHGTIVMAAA